MEAGAKLFQSLFFWNHHLYKRALEVLTIAPIGFNPCFSGTTTYTQTRSRGETGT